LIAASRVLTLIDERTTHMQFSLINTGNESRDLAEESLRELEAVCREAGLPLVWVIVPRAQEIRGGSFWKSSLNGATDRLRGHFLALAEELNDPAVDLKPVLEDVQSRQESYLPGDSHWNEAGHEAVANSIIPELLLQLSP
jgi:hypothetical protein